MTEYRLLKRTTWAGLGENFSGRGPGGESFFLKRLAGLPSALAAHLSASGLFADVGTDAEGVWLVARGEEGESLRWVQAALAGTGGVIKPQEGLAVVTLAADRLASLHMRGQVHGDISPSTIFLSARGEVGLADAGLAPALGTHPEHGPYRSEAGALAPEQAASAPGDVFLLGLVLYELALGRPLFAGPSPADAVKQSAAFTGLDPASVKHVPQPWQALLCSMLHRDPGHRPAMSDVANVLTHGMTQQNWSTGEEELAALFQRASAGRPPSFGADDGQLLQLSRLAPAPSPPAPPHTTPVPGAVLAKVATRKMTREQLAAVKLDDVADAQKSKEQPLDERVLAQLQERRLVTVAQLQQVRTLAARLSLPLLDALFRAGVVEEDVLVSTLAELTHTASVPCKRVLEQVPGPEALSLISKELSVEANCLPLGLKGGTQLMVAMADPLDQNAVNAITRAIGDKSLVTFRAGRNALAKGRARLYGVPLPEEAPPGMPAPAAPVSDLGSRAAEALFKLQGTRGAQALSLVALVENLAGQLDAPPPLCREAAQALAAAALANNRNPWDVPKLDVLQDTLGFGSDAENYAQALLTFPREVPDEPAMRAVVVAFAFAALAQDAKPVGSRRGGLLQTFQARSQLPPDIFEALERALT